MWGRSFDYGFSFHDFVCLSHTADSGCGLSPAWMIEGPCKRLRVPPVGTAVRTKDHLINSEIHDINGTAVQLQALFQTHSWIISHGGKLIGQRWG
jgi:hypothetical protein